MRFEHQIDSKFFLAGGAIAMPVPRVSTKSQDSYIERVVFMDLLAFSQEKLRLWDSTVPIVGRCEDDQEGAIWNYLESPT